MTTPRLDNDKDTIRLKVWGESSLDLFMILSISTAFALIGVIGVLTVGPDSWLLVGFGLFVSSVGLIYWALMQ